MTTIFVSVWDSVYVRIELVIIIVVTVLGGSRGQVKQIFDYEWPQHLSRGHCNVWSSDLKVIRNLEFRCSVHAIVMFQAQYYSRYVIRIF